ncbi:FAD-dependent oxidoreductase [Dictyobacter alpinus]|uniref:FAD-dependent oxidoreductase n=1 Tax=Dictyobacter alpinus TaxID=2014873 RepID=A0A402BC90_9CHLR|nr:NAD(P)/FAD-dependent oxidoreductase [Dictyobacter alpinus]GCE28897.1 FAD-dependent oxidoreductase [Dictyobacter alpinus]
MGQQKKALIIGCGIAGPALALFLQRAGIDAEIYEARTKPDGYSLTLSCNGVAVLQELGLDGAVAAEGAAVTRFRMWNGRGRSLGGGSLASHGSKSYFIKRIPLSNILTDEVERRGIPIFRGKKLSDIKTTSQGGVVASFEDGSSTTGDFLVGCDGVHSRTRQLLYPTFPAAHYTGLINCGGFTANMPLDSEPETMHFIAGKKAFFGYLIGDNGYTYWFTNHPRSTEPARGEFDTIDPHQQKQTLLDLYQDDQPLIRQTIQNAESIFPYFLSYALPEQPASWHQGPIVLLGDAVHAVAPSSGQGASQALEDSGILAKCLRDIPQLEQAFSTYEHLRRARTRKIYQAGQQGDSGKHATTPSQQFFRDLTTPIFLKLFANPKASDWMYSYRINWNQPL